MKVFFLVLLLSFQAVASDEQLCHYLEKNTFKSLVHEVKPKLETKFADLVVQVSVALDKKRAAECKDGKLWAIRDYDSCSSLCLTNGNSDFRISAAIRSKGVIKLSDESRECQSMCKTYQMLAFTYEDGLKEGRTSSQDCTGAVSSGERGNRKIEIEKVSEKVIRKSYSTSQQ